MRKHLLGRGRQPVGKRKYNNRLYSTTANSKRLGLCLHVKAPHISVPFTVGVIAHSRPPPNPQRQALEVLCPERLGTGEANRFLLVHTLSLFARLQVRTATE